MKFFRKLSAEKGRFLPSLIKKAPFSGLYSKGVTSYIILLTVFILWPFDFSFIAGEKNHVGWIKTSVGIEFSKHGQIMSSSPAESLYNRLLNGSGFSLEVWISAQNETQSGPARIVSYSRNTVLRNFALGQSKKKLVMRLRTTDTDPNRVYPHLEVDEVFASPSPQHIVVTYDFSIQSVYINGDRRLRKKISGGKFTNWDPSYYLVLGNEATGDRPWLGKTFLVAIYDRALSEKEVRENYLAGLSSKLIPGEGAHRVSNGLVTLYLFEEARGNRVSDSSGTKTPLDLNIPSLIQTHSRPYLSLSKKSFSQSPRLYRDAVLNIIAFIPLGFLLHAALRNRYGSSLKTSAFVLLIGTLFTFFIESTQHFMLTRYSSILDVLSNMLGTAVGILAEESYTRYLKSRGRQLPAC